MLLSVVIPAVYFASFPERDFYRVATSCDSAVTTLSRCRKDAPAAPTFVNKALPTCIKITVLTIGPGRKFVALQLVYVKRKNVGTEDINFYGSHFAYVVDSSAHK